MTKKIKLKSEFKEMFNKALSLRDEKKYAEATYLLEKIIAQSPDEVPVVYGHLGEIAWRQGELKVANRYFRKTTLLIPESSLASLGVFHTFWEMKEYESALKEITRYRNAGGKCEDYDNIVKSLKEKKIIDEGLNLLQKPDD